jgi:hypothetical protein
MCFPGKSPSEGDWVSRLSAFFNARIGIVENVFYFLLRHFAGSKNVLELSWLVRVVPDNQVDMHRRGALSLPWCPGG